MISEYHQAVVALHNLAVAIDIVRDLPRGTPGYSVTETPMTSVNYRLQRLMEEVCRAIPKGLDRYGSTGGIDDQ